MASTIKAPDERRKELLGIGIELFIDKGLFKVSIKEIVEKAGVAIGLFYYYFKSKDQFVEEVLELYISDQLKEIVAVMNNEALPVTERLIKSLDAFMKHMERISLAIREGTLNIADNHLIIQKKLDILSDELEQLIIQGNSENIFNTLNERISARFIVNGLAGVLQMGLDQNSVENWLLEIRRLTFYSLGLDKKIMDKIGGTQL